MGRGKEKGKEAPESSCGDSPPSHSPRMGWWQEGKGQWVLHPLYSPGDSGKVTTVIATPGQGPERSQEVAYTDIKVIGNGSFGVVYQARLADTRELVAIKKVLQDKRFKVAWGMGMWRFGHDG